MSNGSATQNPFALLTDAQFAVLFLQASGPVLEELNSLQSQLSALSLGQINSITLNTVLQSFQTQYAALSPYFIELASRAAAGT
jgi:hypothetical protein